MERLWEWAFITAIIFLSIPVVSMGITLLAVEVVGSWRMFIWAIDAAAGY